MQSEVPMFDVRLWLAFITVLLLLITCPLTPGNAHDASMAQNSHDAEVFEFYAKWMRPGGSYGVGHRTNSCCNRSDCFPVAEITRQQGNYFVRPEGSVEWYKVPTSVIESNQADPRESPDGLSHVCI